MVGRGIRGDVSAVGMFRTFVVVAAIRTRKKAAGKCKCARNVGRNGQDGEARLDGLQKQNGSPGRERSPGEPFGWEDEGGRDVLDDGRTGKMSDGWGCLERTVEAGLLEDKLEVRWVRWCAMGRACESLLPGASVNRVPSRSRIPYDGRVLISCSSGSARYQPGPDAAWGCLDKRSRRYQECNACTCTLLRRVKVSND